MKKLITFTMIALIISIGFAIVNPSSGYTAPKESKLRVWVEFQPGRKGLVQSTLNAMGAQFHYTFDELNSFVVTLPISALQGISHNPSVVSIEEDVPRYFIAPEPMAITELGDPYIEEIIPYGIDAVQARDVWDVDRDGDIDLGAPTGDNVKVCIIDSGFYSDHDDLDVSHLAGGISQVGDDYQTDGFGHGSHVAGTISAMMNDIGVVGVTPGTVDFHIVKIFGNDGLWVSGASDLVAAIYNCRDNEAKIINMSLGGGSSSRKEQRAFDSIYAAGILSIAAAGNDNVSDPHFPASYESVISVSAVDADNFKADFSNYGEHVELAAPGVGVLSTVPYLDESLVNVNGVEFNGFHVEFTSRTPASGTLVDGGLCDTTGSWVGKVVLCQRGDISFFDKVMNVQNSGGVAALIYNNVDEDLLATLGEGNSSEIIAIGFSQAQGIALLTYLNQIASVSSEYAWPASGYEAWGGTSMATPHVAGVAALIWSSDPYLTNDEIRAAMTETAFDIGNDGWDENFGYGLVQAADAIDYLDGGSVNEHPIVEIFSPVDGAIFNLEAINFSGSAQDDKDGDLSNSLVWDSNLDGVIGSEAAFSAILSEGEHTITATATDSDGEVGVASVEITVSTSPSTDTIRVGDIDMWYSRRGRNYTVFTSVTIIDQSLIPVPVSDASVTVQISGPATTTLSGVTGADGTVTFSFSTRNTGLFTATVDDVTHPIYEYDPDTNEIVETELSVP